MRDVIFIGYIKAELFDLSGAVGTCKSKALDVLLLDGGGQRAIILAVINYVIEVIAKIRKKPIYIINNLESFTCKYFPF